ncbi:hypothetical protein FKG94_24785 [Exilibacterium tricleocarpae]|uniref:Uncharacterized protein n=1 Tax=Exilibacterium tricleocarpae TaxID=2591008 RepID=A0A545SRZ9_9GAMM|nr:hypothetical protein [Exilibacterium tricleocarpae]TQV67750.1 hypothetical protein FKG94_24785 [Exilibacterium tricleocarpae]
MRATVSILILTLLVACDGHIYVRGGLTDGDTFYLPSYVYGNQDPVLQSWVAYSLSRSVCQLEEGGENPARNHSFDCEFSARMTLIERWAELGSPATGGDNLLSGEFGDAAYLDTLSQIRRGGFLREYIWHYLHRRQWRAPPDLRAREFERWRLAELAADHRPQTRIIGFWGYGDAGAGAGSEVSDP